MVRKICVSIVFVLFLAAVGFAETYQVTMGWDHDKPADIAGYDVTCIKDDNASIVAIDINDENLRVTTIPDPRTHLYRFRWMGVVTSPAGRLECYVRARDLAGNVSDWAGPAIRDYDPLPPQRVRILDGHPTQPTP